MTSLTTLIPVRVFDLRECRFADTYYLTVSGAVELVALQWNMDQPEYSGGVYASKTSDGELRAWRLTRSFVESGERWDAVEVPKDSLSPADWAAA